MEIITAEDLMVPVEEYATVREDATLQDAVFALEEAQERRNKSKRPYMHRGILVLDAKGKVVGKIGMIDALMALEPRYKEIGDVRSLSGSGFNPNFLRTMLEAMNFCDVSLSELCAKAAVKKVRDFMYTPTEGEFVDAEASLCDAIHQFVIGRHMGLLVVRDGEIIGILRLSDVFMKVFEMLKQCPV